MISYGMARRGVVWYGTVWFRVLQFTILCYQRIYRDRHKSKDGDRGFFRNVKLM